MTAPDLMTVVQACPGEGILAKTITPTGISAYDRARYYDMYEVRVGGLVDLGGVLKTLSAKPRAAVVRGRPLLATRTTLRRLAHTQDGYPATLGAAPRRWLAVDLDSIPLPSGTDPCDLVACCRVGRAALPPAFHSAGCIVQATGSHGIKPGARIRLWFWLNRTCGDGEAKRWLAGTPADPALLGPVALHYTAAPLFEGRVDHLPRRLAYLPGDEMVEVPSAEELASPPLAERPLPAFTNPVAAGGYVRSELAGALEIVLRATPGINRHTSMVKASARTARLVQAGWLAEETWREAITAAVREVAPDAAQHNIDAALSWALTTTPAPGEEFFQ